ncbi:MAG: C10 family peptidase [Prevotella sp.]|nr:C10 family peptidase [Prevotella sp.]
MKHYSRRLIVLTLALVAAIVVTAKPRTQSQMLQIAKSALSASDSKLNAPSNKAMKVLAQNQALTVFGYEDAGFAVVSADDLVPEVLGVSTSAFNTENKNFMWWLRAAEDAVNNAVANNRRLVTTKPSELGYESAVAPLLTTFWDQTHPYNKYCPSKGSTKCLTGCVATAMAQVLNYHETPIHGYGSRTIYYPYQDLTGEAVTAEFSDHYYDWDNMLDNYSGDFTTEEADAVAMLMRDCGVAADMQYGTSAEGGSGAYSQNAAEGMREYFGIEDAECLMRDDYSEKEWMNIVYYELSEHGPLYYGGADPTPFFGGGHAFVLHGYNADGKVYVNWGWSGDSDGYYDISLLNPPGMSFSYGQDMIIGVYSEPKNLASKEVTLEAAGTLKDQITEEEAVLIDSLKVTGDINSDDLRFIRFMAGCDENGDFTKGYLTVLDLSDAKFVEGGDAYLIDQEENTKLTISNSNLPERAFYGCRRLRSVELPSGISSYGEGAFALCRSLKELRLTPAANADFLVEDSVVWNKDKTAIIAIMPFAKDTLEIPSGVEKINNFALAGCAHLTAISLPKSLTTIGREAFRGCSSLTELRVNSRTVPQLIGSDVFAGISMELCKLYVKRDTKQDFVRTTQWSAFNTYSNVFEFGTAIKAINKVRDYGDANPILTYKMMGEKVSGMPQLTCAAEPNSTTGRYPIIVEKGTLQIDESVDLIDGYLVVKKAELTVSIADATRAVGEDDPEFTLTFTGFKLGEDESVIDEMPTVQTTATADSPAGKYEYQLVGGSAANYEFIYDGKGVFTITGSVPSAITGLVADGESVDVYTLNGTLLRRVNNLRQLPRGIYVVKGRKVVVTD